MSFVSPAEAAAWLTDTANGYMDGPANDIHLPGAREKAFDLPLIAFAAGNDPMWDSYKEHVGAFHWTPLEAFRLAYPEEAAEAPELSVMSWILPQTEATRRDNRKEKTLPAERWVRARFFGENPVHEGLHRHITAALHGRGIQAVSPVLMPEWTRMDSDTFVFASTWSERHAAYAAGLGTFGVCDGLITPRGKAMRVGSVIVRLALPVNERPYSHHREYCLLYNSGTCGVCIRRCPAGALSPAGHDKLKCKAYLREVTRPYVKNTWHFDGYGCGLCQVGVPCEKGIPPRPKHKEA